MNFKSKPFITLIILISVIISSSMVIIKNDVGNVFRVADITLDLICIGLIWLFPDTNNNTMWKIVLMLQSVSIFIGLLFFITYK
jgi:hypothetical protein